MSLIGDIYNIDDTLTGDNNNLDLDTLSVKNFSCNVINGVDGIKINNLANSTSDLQNQINALVGAGAGAIPIFSIGTTSTLAAGNPATVIKTGNNLNPILSFSIPQGADGLIGTTPNISIGTTSTISAGVNASVIKSGTLLDPIFSFSIPQGVDGQNGYDGAGFLYRGSWSSIIYYTKNDVVNYNNSSYIALQSSFLINPSNILYWDILALKGTDGTNGLNGNNGNDGTNGSNGGKGDKGDKGEKGDAGDATIATASSIAAGVSAGIAAVAATAAAVSATTATTSSVSSAASATVAEEQAILCTGYARHFLATDTPSKEICVGNFSINNGAYDVAGINTTGDMYARNTISIQNNIGTVLQGDATGNFYLKGSININDVGGINNSGDLTCKNINTGTAGIISTNNNINFAHAEVGLANSINNTSVILGSSSGTVTLNSNTSMGTGKKLISAGGIDTNSINYLSSIGGQAINIGTNGTVGLVNSITIGSATDIIYLNGVTFMNSFNMSSFINQIA